MYLSEDFRLKAGLAEMLKGGVIMDVTNVEQAQIAEKAGACAVMALLGLIPGLPKIPFFAVSIAVGVLAQKKGLENAGRLVFSAKSWLSHPGVDRTAAILPPNAPEGGRNIRARAKAGAEFQYPNRDNISPRVRPRNCRSSPLLRFAQDRDCWRH